MHSAPEEVLPRLRQSSTRSLPLSKRESEMRGASPPRLDALISTCAEFKGVLGVSMSRFLHSLRRKQRSLVRAHRQAQHQQCSWRNQPQYSVKRNDIKEAISDRNNQVKEKEAQFLQYIVGLSDSRKNSSEDLQCATVTEGLSLKDLMSSRMTHLLSINKRDFGHTYASTPLRLMAATPVPPKKPKIKLQSDNVMLKREIIRFKRQDLLLATQNIPPPAVPQSRDVVMPPVLDDKQLAGMSPLNRFIFKQRQRFQPKTTPHKRL